MYVCMYVSNVGYSTSIFQILFTDIHIRHSFVYSICVASQSNILVSLSFTSQHPYFKIQCSTSLIQHYALTIQHIHFKYYSHSTFVCVLPQPLQHRMLGVCVLWCRVRYACNAIINILVWTLNFPFPVSPLQSRVFAHFVAYVWCTTT